MPFRIDETRPLFQEDHETDEYEDDDDGDEEEEEEKEEEEATEVPIPASTFDTSGIKGTDWTTKNLLALTDSLRDCIDNYKPIPTEQIAELVGILDLLHKSWSNGEKVLTISDMIDSHFDGLICDLRNAYDKFRNAADETNDANEFIDQLNDANQNNFSLGKRCDIMSDIWNDLHELLGSDRIRIIRLEEMQSERVAGMSQERVGTKKGVGMLQGMRVGVSNTGNGPVVTATVTVEAAGRCQRRGDADFMPGSWWPCKESAAKDGIIALGHSNATSHELGKAPTALLLMHGKEIPGPTLGMTKWTVPDSELMINDFLLCREAFRVLRAQTLDGPYAPSAGIRYDGVYRKASWGTRTNAEGKTVHTLTLVRSDGQVPLNAVLQHPLPHEHDLYKVYQGWVRSEMRKQLTPEAYVTWRQSEIQRVVMRSQV